MKGITSKITNYLFIVIGFLLALQGIYARIIYGSRRNINASVSIMTVYPLEISFVVICKRTEGNLKKRCNALKKHIFDSDSMDEYDSNLIRELEATREIVVADDEYRIVHNNLTLYAYNYYYMQWLTSPDYGYKIIIQRFQQMDVGQQKVVDRNKSYGKSTIYYVRFNMRYYNTLKLKERNGDNDDLINWFNYRYVFNEEFNSYHSRDVQCNSYIYGAEGPWEKFREYMEIDIRDRVDNLGYFNDTRCAVESDVALHEISIDYYYARRPLANFNIICAINGSCYINLEDNEHFFPQLGFGKYNNFRICLTGDEIRFVTCDKFNLLVFQRLDSGQVMQGELA